METTIQNQLAEDFKSLSISDIALEIRRNWKNVNYAAKPYLDAMDSMETAQDTFGFASGKSVIGYFLANASSFRGEIAKAIKKELLKRIK